MLAYNSRNWLQLSLAYRGTVIPRVLWRVVAFAVLALAVHVGHELYLATLAAPSSTDPLRHLKPLAHMLVGVALGMLIVFRNNCSYDRYWEGRKLWGGIVNASRNLLRGAAVYADADVTELPGLVTAFAVAVKQRLRKLTDLSEIQPHLPAQVYTLAADALNPPAVIALHMSRWVQSRVTAGTATPIAGEGLEQQIRALLDHQGGCERIVLTPVPFAYAAHNKQLLMLYLLSLPFVLVGEMGWAAVPAVAAIAFGLLGIEEAGAEIENPFGTDPNDLELDDICVAIRRDAMATAALVAR